ncbi:MAG TPA: radical SAM family heme chaperone HemW [Erysipelotrichaceae bacterium]|nr:radical SAM family heme chaperone HemW [Erysipelotrichaceae bacterium]
MKKLLKKLLTINKMSNQAKSLYIHIPFCEKICDYCDFTKLQYFRNFAVPYLESLKKELDFYQPHSLSTIYVGGGTPTALELDLFQQLLEIIAPFSTGVIEYTFEANPESLSKEKISLMKQFGVNRVSLGVQTTDDKILAAINRSHRFKDVQTAINNLKKGGIENINVDLILGLPYASKRLLIKDLNRILSLGVKHISCYSLTVHPHTVLYRKGYREIDDDILREYYDIVEEILTKNNYIHYEVSNYCLPSFESKHNLTYWRNEHYYGVGLGTSGYLDNVRYKNTKNLNKYLKGQYLDEEEILNDQDRLFYQIMLNLRTIEGLSLKELKEDFSLDLYQQKKDIIDEFIKQKYLYTEGDYLKPTYQGMMILDAIILKLI